MAVKSIIHTIDFHVNFRPMLPGQKNDHIENKRTQTFSKSHLQLKFVVTKEPSYEKLAKINRGRPTKKIDEEANFYYFRFFLLYLVIYHVTRLKCSCDNHVTFNEVWWLRLEFI